MLRARLRIPIAALWTVGLAWFLAISPPAAGEETGLTFFGWSDQHVATSGDAKHLLPAIDAMNALPGTRYPERFGGVVAKPAFVLGCGDITQWPTAAAKNAYAELVAKRLKSPAYDIAGNHDEGGKVPSRTVLDWIAARHKSLSYAFDSGGLMTGGLRFLAKVSRPRGPRAGLQAISVFLTHPPSVREFIRNARGRLWIFWTLTLGSNSHAN